ncbi:unnamed protein product [Closterium sp. NIES-53]
MTTIALSTMGGEPTSFNDPPARLSSWKAAQFAERLLITPLDIPDADAPEMKPDMTPGMTLEDQTLSAYDTAPHFLLNGLQPRDVDIESQQSRRQLQAERHDDGCEPTREMIENPAASTKTIKALQVDTSNKTAGISSSATATAGRAAAASGAGDLSPSPAEMLDGASFERLTLVSPRSTADFDFAIAVKNLADSDRESDSFKIKGDFGDSDSEYGDNFPMMVLPRRPRRASYSGSGESFPPKSPPLTTSINSTWRSNGSIAGKAASASSFLNRPPIADTSAGRGWRGALTPRSGALGQRLCSPHTEWGSNSDAAAIGPNQRDVFFPASNTDFLNVIPHSASLNSIGQIHAKVSVQRSRSHALFCEIPGTVFEDPQVGAPIPEIKESDDGADCGSVFSNVAPNGDGAFHCYTPRGNPLGNKAITIVHQRHHKRHSIGEINGTIFEQLCQEDEEKASPTQTQCGPQTVQEKKQFQQQRARRFSRSHSVQCNQVSNSSSIAHVDSRCATTGVTSTPNSPFLIGTVRSGAPSPRVGSRSVRQSSSDMFEPSGSEAAGPSTSPTEHSASVAPRPSSSAGRIPLLLHRQHHHRRSFSICASDCTTSISSGISGSISGGGGSSGGATPPGTDYSAAGYPAAGNKRNPTTPCTAPGGGAAFCPSPRWVGKRSPVAFQRDVWPQQRGCQQGERQHARRHSVSEIDGSVFEELAVAAQRLQE